MTELWLVRHGLTDWNLNKRWQGQTTDAPGINATGLAQAHEARDQLRGMQFSAIYSSDSLRALQTAEILAEPLGMSVTLEPRLREINLGDWEGMFFDEIQSQYSQEYEDRMQNPLEVSAPNGETPGDMADRVLQAVGVITRKYPAASVLLVSHGVSLAAIICQAKGFSMAEVYERMPEHGQPVCIEWG